jgi:hypothetical protein
MNQIAEGQKRSSENKLPLKEVKSKIFADFKPPKLIRPLNIKLVFLETLFISRHFAIKVTKSQVSVISIKCQKQIYQKIIGIQNIP